MKPSPPQIKILNKKIVSKGKESYDKTQSKTGWRYKVTEIKMLWIWQIKSQCQKNYKIFQYLRVTWSFSYVFLINFRSLRNSFISFSYFGNVIRTFLECYLFTWKFCFAVEKLLKCQIVDHVKKCHVTTPEVSV